MTDPPVTRKRGGPFGTTPDYSKLVDDTPLVCSAQTSWCEHGNTRIEQLANGPHFAKEVCTDCGATLRFVPKPETLARRKLNAFRLARLAMCDKLTHWERKFCRSVLHRQKVSPKQQQIIERLCATYLEGKAQ